ncbi:MAG: hypothetical protein MUF22_06090 [Chitinispirillaceae bacterium]|jgi:hypothetical protein|nr:hypothetical protein [Chitinispirillaceae bacterium]
MRRDKATKQLRTSELPHKKNGAGTLSGFRSSGRFYRAAGYFFFFLATTFFLAAFFFAAIQRPPFEMMIVKK